MKSTKEFVSTEAGVRLCVRAVGAGPRLVLIPNGMHLLDDFAPLAIGRTLVFSDVRGRGWSDSVDDPALLAGGIVNDAADLEAVRGHFGAARVDVIGHSYQGLAAILYAMRHPDRVNRIVQIGPIGPDQSTTYPPELSNIDDTFKHCMTSIGELQKERAALDPVEFCRRFWDALRPLYVTNPVDADRIRWDRCDLANERGFMKMWFEHILPSMHRLQLTRDALTPVVAPVLTVHGTKDRSSPYGAGCDWVEWLPNARLLSIENAGHAPWIEEPETVFAAMTTFLDGSWPTGARGRGEL